MGDHVYGYVKDGKLFLKGFLDFPDREIGEVKDDEASAIHYFEERFKMYEKKVEEIEKTVAASENKGSYLMKLLHLKKMATTFDGLGDFESLYKRLEKLEGQLTVLIAENRKKNLEIKTALLSEAEKLADSSNWKEDSEKLKELKSKWIKTGNVEKEHEKKIEERFSEIVNNFFARRKAFFEEKNEMNSQRVKSYQHIISKALQAKKLDQPKAVKIFINLQKEWKEVGKVPPQQLDPLWKEFREINDQVFKSKRDIKKGEVSGFLNEKELLAEKKELLQKAKALNDQDNKNAAALVRELRSLWKRSGPLPREHRKISDEFFYACEMVTEKNFLNELVKNKFKGFDKKSWEEQRQLKERLLTDLLHRDQSELETFQENMANVTINTDAAHRLMNSKLRLHTRKVLIKKAILQQLKGEK